jgi:hypothetical protein
MRYIFTDSYAYHKLILLIIQMVIIYISKSMGPSCIGKDPFLVLPCLVDTHLTGFIK